MLKIIHIGYIILRNGLKLLITAGISLLDSGFCGSLMDPRGEKISRHSGCVITYLISNKKVRYRKHGASAFVVDRVKICLARPVRSPCKI